ncbi:MAG: hypothetical protein R2815_10735 [Flavobacteriales bacterium]|nr:hypothetical protein [Flavobacteriales bacterium]
MDLAHIRDYTHKHCRFKLRSGKEIFGVIWEVETVEHRLAQQEGGNEEDGRRLFFASVRDYERLQSHPDRPVGVIPMHPEEIVLAESLAS